MGGVSDGTLDRECGNDDRAWLALRGSVSLENNGGFVQMAADLEADGGPVDISDAATLILTVRGNGDTYGCHLKTADTTRPWQSYRQSFAAPAEWTDIALPLPEFRPHRVDSPFDPSRVRRIGLVAIGRKMDARLDLAGVALG